MRGAVVIGAIVMLSLPVTALSVGDLSVTGGDRLWIEENASMDVLCDTLNTSDYQVCYMAWEQLEGSLNVSRSIEAEGRTGYRLQLQNQLMASFNLDSEFYGPDDTIVISGTVRAPGGQPIPNATVRGIIDAEGIGRAVTTTQDGGFQARLPAPNQEGAYQVRVVAEKSPYRAASQSTPFSVHKEPDLSLLVPSTVTVAPNTTGSIEFLIQNKGYAPATSIEGTVTGELDGSVTFDNAFIQPNNGINASLSLLAPRSATGGTYPITVTVAANGQSRNATINVTVGNGAQRTPTGRLTSFDGDVRIDVSTVVGLLVLGLIVGAGFVVRRRSPGLDGRDISSNGSEHKYSYTGGSGDGWRQEARSIKEELNETMFD